MNLIDFILFPIYVIIPVFFVLYYSTKYIEDSILKRFFYQGFLLKITGAIMAFLIYIYYYKGGDTCEYFRNGIAIGDYLYEYPFHTFTVLFSKDLIKFDDPSLIPFVTDMHYCFNKSSFLISKIAFILSIVCFRSFFISSILCSYLSFWSSWKFYKFLLISYPQLKKSFGYAIFYVPSVIFWGSGLFKDTFTLIGLQLFIVGIIQIIGFKRKIASSIIFVILGYYLLITIRSFYILSILPFILLWIFSLYFNTVKRTSMRWTLFPIFTSFVFIMVFVSLKYTTESIDELSSEKLQDKIEGFQSWHTALKGSAYSLGKIDFSTFGIIQKIPAAINVTFFRPYLWESNKIVILISSLQSLFYLLFTIYIMYQLKFIYFFIYLFRKIEIWVFLGFSLFYGFIAGFTSFNFGALDRYKIPCLSTYLIALLILRFEYFKTTNHNTTDKS